MKARVTKEPFPADLLAQLNSDEADHVAACSARPDTFTIFAQNGENLIGYVVFGKEEGGDILVVYAARALVSGLGPMMMRQLLGVAEVLGQPLRVHTDKVRAMARIMGADVAIEARDVDGLLHGVFL